MRVKPITEAAFTRMVLDLARLRGWRTFHARPGRTLRGWRTCVSGDGVGFPDLLLVHPGRGLVVVCELKVGSNRPSPQQSAWLAAFRAAGVRAYCWRPANWNEIEAVLGEG